jgi:hypothetical protein
MIGSGRISRMGLLFIGAWLRSATAQSTANVPSSDHGQYAYGLIAIDPVPYLGAGFGTTWRPRLIPRTLQVEGGVALPVYYLNNAQNWRLSTGARLLLWGADVVLSSEEELSDLSQFAPSYDWGVAGQMTFRLERTAGDPFTTLSTVLDAHIQPGLFQQHWFLAADLAYSSILSTHFRFSSLVRNNFNDGVASPPRDGWYAFPGGHFLVGLIFGHDLGRSYEIDVRADLKATQSFNNPWSDYNVPAFVTQLNLVRHFGR